MNERRLSRITTESGESAQDIDRFCPDIIDRMYCRSLLLVGGEPLRLIILQPIVHHLD